MKERNFPKTVTEFNEAGYRFESSGVCRGCKAEITWWRTPNGKMMPLNSRLEPHWTDCSARDMFRRKRSGEK